VREFSAPLTVEIPATGNLTDDVVTNAAEVPAAVVFARRTDDGWGEVTAARFLAEVRSVAKGLVAAGIGAGDRVALISKTRYEWTLVDYAIWFAGAVTVPVYETSSSDQIEWILGDSGAVAVMAEGPEHTARIAERRSRLTDLNHVWSLADNGVEVLSRLGEDISDDVLEDRRTRATPLDLATVIYTSGTTGRPKGCQLTHGNFMAELGVAVPELHQLFEADDASTLLFLPLAHVFARIIQIGAVKARVRLGHSSDVKRLLPDLAEFQPTFLLAVPRVFEKVFKPMFPRTSAAGYLFLSEDGNRLSNDQFYQNFEKIVELARDAGVPLPEDLRPHGLRRTFATNELERNPLAYRKVLRKLGHTYPSAAAPYLIATDADVEDEQSDLIDIFVSPDIEKRGKK